jgi:hypothetical protein
MPTTFEVSLMISRGGPPIIPPKPEDVLDEEPEVIDKVVNWRYEELFRAGFNARQALQLASDRNVDLHDALALIKKCKDEHIAFDILS